MLPARGDLGRKTRDEIVVRLKKAGATYRQISAAMGISTSQAQRAYRAATGEQFQLDAEQHKRELYADLELLIEALRPYVHDDELPPDKDDVAGFLRVNKAKALLLGLEAPTERTLTADIGMTVDNPQAAAYVADLVAWTRKHNAISVEGNVRVHLPPGMTERPSPSVDPSSNGHAGADGNGMWSMVLEYPRLDEDQPTC